MAMVATHTFFCHYTGIAQIDTLLANTADRSNVLPGGKVLRSHFGWRVHVMKTHQYLYATMSSLGDADIQHALREVLGDQVYQKVTVMGPNGTPGSFSALVPAGARSVLVSN